MVLLCYLAMPAVRHSFSFTASSVQRKANPIPDALSQLQFQLFRCLAPYTDPTPSQLPTFLLAALQTPWLRRTSSYLHKVLHPPPDECTELPKVDLYFLLPERLCKPGWLHTSSQWRDSHVLCFFIGTQPEPFLHQGLSAVRSLHIDHGFPDPLVNSLHLQCLLRSIKRIQGPASPRRLPIIADHLRVIQHSWDLSTRDHVKLWAVCCLGFFFFVGQGVHGQLCVWS